MDNFDVDEMDFGDDDDAEFLTGKLAALGIDEDLELSGGEEENEDPTTTTTTKTSQFCGTVDPCNAISSNERRSEEAPIDTVGAGVSAKVLSPLSYSSSRDARERPLGDTATTLSHEKEQEEAEPDMEDGQVLDMLQRPLRTRRVRRGCPRDTEDEKAGRKSRKRNITISECAQWICYRLHEPKYYLMCQVVAAIGYNTSKRLLGKVRAIQEAGGMPTADGTRKRSPGGVFFTLLKAHMEPATLKALYADEIRVKREKDRARRAAVKRKAAGSAAGEQDTSPRDARRQQAGGGGSGGGGCREVGTRDMERWVGPEDGCAPPKRVRPNDERVAGGSDFVTARAAAAGGYV